MAIVGYIFICLVYGTTFLAIKIGLNQGISPFYMAALRFSFASLLILIYLAAMRASFPRSIKQYGEIALLGFLMTTIPFGVLFWSEQHIPSGMASLLVATAPVFIAILGRADKGQWIGAIMAIAGVYFVATPELQAGHFTWQTLVACISIVGSEFFFAIGAVRSKRALSGTITPLMFNGLQMAFASIGLFLLSFLFEQPLRTVWTSGLAISLLYLAIVASVFASGVFYWLVKITNPLFPSTWTYVAPIIALLVGYSFLNEKMTPSAMVGALLVIGGVMIVNRKIFISIWQTTVRRSDPKTTCPNHSNT